ncbi:MAG: cytochrome P450, partial [Chloroflexota bacterium]
VREVLVKKSKKFQKPFNVKFATRTLNIENLFSSDGELWEKLRKVMQPAFHTRRISAYVDTMREYSVEIINGWESGKEIDTPNEMMNLTLATTTRALFGKDMRNDEAGDAIIRFIELFFDRITKFPIPAWVPTSKNSAIKGELKTIFDWLTPLIEERKEDPQAFDDIMAMLIEAQQIDESSLLTDRQISNEVANLFAAGYEVVAHTLVFTLYLVSQHPEVREKIDEELRRVVKDEPISLAHIGQLTYLEMVLKESMRLLPVTTVLTRQTSERVELGGYILPKDRLILFAPWTLQRNEAHFPDALAFKPERFHPETGDAYHRYTYLPFSSGPRVCIGNAFSMLQMKINLATIWQRFDLTFPDDAVFEPTYSFNTRPKNGLPLIVKEKTHAFG